MTSGGSAPNALEPFGAGAGHLDPVAGGGERLAHLLRDQGRVVVDEQQVGHGRVRLGTPGEEKRARSLSGRRLGLSSAAPSIRVGSGSPGKPLWGQAAPAVFGGNRCSRSSEGITSSDGVAAEAQEGVPLGMICLPSAAFVFKQLAAKVSTRRGKPMTTAPRNKRFVVGGMVALALAVFFLDVPFPRGETSAPLFVAVVGASLWLPGLRAIFIAAFACTLLTVLAFFFGPARADRHRPGQPRFLDPGHLGGGALLRAVQAGGAEVPGAGGHRGVLGGRDLQHEPGRRDHQLERGAQQALRLRRRGGVGPPGFSPAPARPSRRRVAYPRSYPAGGTRRPL